MNIKRETKLKATKVYRLDFNYKTKRVTVYWTNKYIGQGEANYTFKYKPFGYKNLQKDFSYYFYQDLLKKIKALHILDNQEYVILTDGTEIDVEKDCAHSFVSYKINKNKQLVEHVDYDDHGSGWCEHHHYWTFMNKVSKVFLTKKDYEYFKNNE